MTLLNSMLDALPSGLELTVPAVALALSRAGFRGRDIDVHLDAVIAEAKSQRYEWESFSGLPGDKNGRST